ncbi:MAG TPA: hypothetical protein VFK48_00875 [Usitatibacter sp.]|nr:hypothetical protein [Usitatibacter sp.]
MEDIRNHDSMPTPEEREWMEADTPGAILRGFLLAAVALGIGLVASMLVTDVVEGPANIAVFGPR